ncbi:MAG: hypothetical protein ACRCXZ_04135 [Patescibacteria group bacterium]
MKLNKLLVFSTSVLLTALLSGTLVNAQTIITDQSGASLAVPSKTIVPNLKLSPEAKKAFEIVKSWSKSSNRVWYVVYREKNESYIFISFNNKGYIVETNPERGGSEFTIPKNKLFTVNTSLLRRIVNKQNNNGAYQLPNGAYENYITPLIQVDINGTPLPNQHLSPYWAIHSPPYRDLGKPVSDLSLEGNSCLRVKNDFAKFTQELALNEINSKKARQFILRRWDNSLFK